METVGFYLSPREGIIVITRRVMGRLTYYDAYESPNFLYMIRSAGGSACHTSLKKTLKRVKRGARIRDLGEYILYTKEEEDGTLTVSLKQPDGSQRAKASAIPTGAHLSQDAFYFFNFYRSHKGLPPLTSNILE